MRVSGEHRDSTRHEGTRHIEIHDAKYINPLGVWCRAMSLVTIKTEYLINKKRRSGCMSDKYIVSLWTFIL